MVIHQELELSSARTSEKPYVVHPRIPQLEDERKHLPSIPTSVNKSGLSNHTFNRPRGLEKPQYLNFDKEFVKLFLEEFECTWEEFKPCKVFLLPTEEKLLKLCSLLGLQ